MKGRGTRVLRPTDLQAASAPAAIPHDPLNAGLVAAGGGLSGTTLAVVGAGVVGAGALAATQLGGGNDSVEYAGPMSGQLSIAFGPCLRLERYSMTLTIELTGEAGGTAGSQPGKYEVLSATNCATGPQTGDTKIFGISPTPLTRSGSAVSFSYRESVSGGGETVADFKGTLSGDLINGTFTMISRVPNLTGISESTPLVATVSLSRK